jgi:uncharacterized protein (TIGR01777 family)
MKVVLAGSSGFLGTHLRARLASAGHDLTQLVRRAPRASDEREWHPERGELDPELLRGADAVVNLAGIGVGDKRWTDAYRHQLLTSRVEPTATIADTLAALPDGERPAVLLNASAVGFYGDTGDSKVDEGSAGGSGYFPDLCREWERAAVPAQVAGVRVVWLRTGFPLEAEGGLLKPLLVPFRLGFGGQLGNGRQWMPWLSMRDWLAAVEFLLEREDIAGAVNVVGPEPVRNRDFSRALGRVLRRPSLFPVPPIALRIAIGQFSHEALASQRVLPGVLTAHGFLYEDSTVESALRATLEKRD